MTKILGLSGKKQSGKNTSANFIVGIYMRGLDIVRGHIEMQPDGRFAVSDIFGDTDMAGIFDITRNNESMLTFLDEYIHPYVKLYSCADILKHEVCMGLLNLSYEQCFGTDSQKNTETSLRWEDMPGIFATDNDEIFLDYEGLDFVQHTPGPMTAREVMQYVGTDIFRKMYDKVWVNSLIKRIEHENSHLAIVTDVRFINEVEGIQEAGGKVVRLLRDPSDGKDQHYSETALDDYPLEKFDAYIDNKEMDIEEQCVATRLTCAKWENYMPEHIYEKKQIVV